MTAATPGPPPRDHHDGQVTPGQAAYETFPRAPWEDGLTPSWETMSEADRGYWHRAAQAAIDAATEGALRACGYTLADVGRFLEAEAAPQPAPELAAAMAEARGYRHALARVREILDEGGTTHGSRLSRARSIIGAALEGK